MSQSLSTQRGHAPVEESPGPSEFLRAGIEGLLVPDVLSIAAQPIVRLVDLAIVGYEALMRVPLRPHNSPDWWLERASELGLRSRLEIAAWRAISAYGPPPDDALLFLNASPTLLGEPDLRALRSELPERIVIEVTEQEAVADYISLREDLQPWLSSNARLAIDDTGAGYSSLRHVIELSPDFLKIDHALVSSVDKDRNRRALVRSLVAFAREVGCTVIAEGVESAGELEVLRDAEVDLAQGFLLGRPARPWRGATGPQVTQAPHGRGSRSLARFTQKLDRANDVSSACEATVEFLYRRGDLMPSIYLERGDKLRCIAQRGLWQVLDGLGPNSGITGRTWSRGEPIVVSDVATSPEYLEAIPGVRSEACVPILRDGHSVGALNVESLHVIEPHIHSLLALCTQLLAARLSIVGWGSNVSLWERAAQASITMSELSIEGNPATPALAALCAAGELDSGALIVREGDQLAVQLSIGPLTSVLQHLPHHELERLSHLVDGMSACYTTGEGTGRGFVGTDSLRAFARAVVVLPLRSGGQRLGTVVLANSTPRPFSGMRAGPLELLAGQFAATLTASKAIDRLRRQAHEDHLTRLGNRSALAAAFDLYARRPGSKLTAILDVDNFKVINDKHGHLIGDAVLCEVTERLRRDFPAITFYRYGGDEFALLLGDTDPEAAKRLADELCRSANEVLAPYGSALTAGFARAAWGEEPHEVFARADGALLWAKRHARGTAVFAEDPPRAERYGVTRTA